jgi:poly[(R)-3-hydroxyalkanoate] polymerase subunit PhaC
MSNIKSNLNQHDIDTFLFNYDTFADRYIIFAKMLSSSLQFNTKLSNAFTAFYQIYLNTISEYNISWKDFSELDKLLRSRAYKIFNQKFREADFINSLSNIVANYSELAKITGIGKIYQHISNMLSVWNNIFAEPARDTLYRAPSHKVCELGKYSLFRYDRSSAVLMANTEKSTNMVTQNKEMAPHPILVIYAFINRHYILDLLPEVSVIRNLLDQGRLDILATDWGTPAAYDKSLNIGHFVNDYIDKSIDFIREITDSDKVTLFGYCWGGDLALMYAALHPEKVKNLVTIATPGDFDLDNSLLSVWTRSVKEDYLLEAFGNVPGMLLNAAFNLRRPIEYSHKYVHFFAAP